MMSWIHYICEHGITVFIFVAFFAVCGQPELYGYFLNMRMKKVQVVSELERSTLAEEVS